MYGRSCPMNTFCRIDRESKPIVCVNTAQIQGPCICAVKLVMNKKCIKTIHFQSSPRIAFSSPSALDRRVTDQNFDQVPLCSAHYLETDQISRTEPYQCSALFCSRTVRTNQNNRRLRRPVAYFGGF